MSDSKNTRALQVSVVVNVWGNDDSVSLSHSLDSIRRQNHKPDEVIVVVDGSINLELERVIQKFTNDSDLVVKQIRIAITKGLWNARNEGIRAAQCEFVALHDADDMMHPERLQFQLRELDTLSADVICTPAWEFDVKNGKIINLRKCRDEVLDIHTIFWNNTVNHSSVIARRDALIEIGGYRNVHLVEDYDLWLRLIINGGIIRQSGHVLQALGVNTEHLARRAGFQFLSSEKSIHDTLRSLDSFLPMILWIRLIARLSYRIGPRCLRKIHRGRRKNRNTVNGPSEIYEFLKREPAIAVF